MAGKKVGTPAERIMKLREKRDSATETMERARARIQRLTEQINRMEADARAAVAAAER